MASLLTLDIVAGYGRPVVLLKEDITCLIDTGANIPVWTRGSQKLINAFQASLIKDKKFILSGFGKVAEKVDAFRISDFVLSGDGDDKIVFKSMIIACTERPAMVANMILPATAFNHMNYLIHNVGIDNPVVEIEHDKNEYAMGAICSNIDGTIIDRVYSFANE